MNSKICEHIVNEGTYIPETNTVYPEKPDAPLWNPPLIKQLTFDKNYPFLDKSFKARFMSILMYIGIFVLVFPLNTIRYGLRIKGRSNLRKCRKFFKNGAMTIANHIYRWDFLAVLQAVKYRRLWFPAKTRNIMTSDGNIIRFAGGIPIPEDISVMRVFNEAFDYLHSKKKWLHVFPESCRWDFYEPIRPFKKGAFSIAYKYNLPIIPMVFSYRKPTGIYKLFGVKHPLLTLTVGEVKFFDKSLRRSEAIDLMRKNCHEEMVKNAGIKSNCWEYAGD